MLDPMTEALRTTIDVILDGIPTDRRTLLAVDGVDGSGKSTFAAAISEQASNRDVVLIHLDDFLNPSHIRHRRGHSSPEGFFADTYDYDALHQFVLKPLAPTGDGVIRPASYDSALDARVPGPLQRVPYDAIVIIEGMFLHRDEFTDVWDRSVFLDVAFVETARRMSARDGSNPDPEHASMRRYVEGQRIYFRTAHPWTRSDFVIDNTTPATPKIIKPSLATALHNAR